MMHYLYRSARWAVWALLLMPISSTAADPPDTAARVKELLETGWKISSERYAAAQQQYQQARQAAPGDVRLNFAMALVAMKNQHLDDAAKYLDEALANGKPHLPVRQVRFWLDLQRKDKAAQQADLRKLAQALKDNPTLAATGAGLETAHWLGAVLGYYGTEPGRSQISTADLAALDAEITRLLPGSLADKFTAGKTEVEEKAKSLTDQLTTGRQQAKDKNEAKRDEDRKKNEELVADASAKLATAQQALDQFRQQSRIGALEQEDRDLNATLRDLVDRGKRLQSQIKNHDDEEDRRAQKDKNYRKQTDFADNNALSDVSQRAQMAQSRRADLNRVLPGLRKTDTQLAADVGSQNGKLKTLNTEKTRLGKPADSKDGPSDMLQAKLMTFGTYTGMDLEQEKKVILDTYNPK